MAVQTVEAYAQVGDMLLELKDATPHGEFQERCAEALSAAVRRGASNWNRRFRFGGFRSGAANFKEPRRQGGELALRKP